MIKLFETTLPLPPTSNHIYYNKPGGGRGKTTEARSWQNRSRKEIMRQAALSIQSAFDVEGQYCLILYFWFERIMNKGWEEFYKRGKKKGQRKADTKWKKMDQTNRIKLAEDTVSSVSGVDDCANFITTTVKDCDPDNPRMVISFYKIEESDPWPTKKP